MRILIDNMNSISIIIPIYNTSTKLDSCIRSVVNQSFTQWELILVDDGSTDGSGIICDKWAASNKYIHVVHQINQGRSMARNNGVRKATGEWICFIDSDDTIPSDSLLYLSCRISENTDVVFGNGYTLGSDYKEIIDIETFRHLAVRGEGTIGVPWGTLFRRTLLTSYVFDVPRDFYMGEDYIFWLRIIFSTDQPVYVVKEPVYEKTEDNTSSKFVWTSDYAQRIQEYRLAAIPKDKRPLFMADTIADRIANLFAVTLFEQKHLWKKSLFYRQLINDMHKTGIRLTIKQRLFLSLPSRTLRNTYSHLSRILHS